MQKTMEVASTTTAEAEGLRVCCVCLENVSDRGGGAPLFAPGCCGTWMHFNCAAQMPRGSKCPMCRANVVLPALPARAAALFNNHERSPVVPAMPWNGDAGGGFVLPPLFAAHTEVEVTVHGSGGYNVFVGRRSAIPGQRGNRPGLGGSPGGSAAILVADYASVSIEVAAGALSEHANDAVNAIMALTSD